MWFHTSLSSNPITSFHSNGLGYPISNGMQHLVGNKKRKVRKKLHAESYYIQHVRIRVILLAFERIP